MNIRNNLDINLYSRIQQNPQSLQNVLSLSVNFSLFSAWLLKLSKILKLLQFFESCNNFNNFDNFNNFAKPKQQG
jgi:hypothetical protein